MLPTFGHVTDVAGDEDGADSSAASVGIHYGSNAQQSYSL